MTGDRPAVSVVVPFYEAERYLGETLASIEAQTEPADEIVLVDDGSTDGGPAVAADHVGPAQVVTLAHGGIGAARNAGLARARGELVAFCDADDLWEPTKLARQRAELEAHPELGAVLCGVQEFVSPELDPEVIGVRPVRRRDEGVATSALLVRRSVVDEVGDFDETLTVGEWFDWYARLRETGHPIGAVDEVLVRRRLHETNNGRRHQQSRGEYLQVLRAHLARTRPS